MRGNVINTPEHPNVPTARRLTCFKKFVRRSILLKPWSTKFSERGGEGGGGGGRSKTIPLICSLFERTTKILTRHVRLNLCCSHNYAKTTLQKLISQRITAKLIDPYKLLVQIINLNGVQRCSAVIRRYNCISPLNSKLNKNFLLTARTYCQGYNLKRLSYLCVCCVIE